MSNDQFIQQASDEIGVVVYDSPLPPKYFKIKKRFFKIFVIFVPIISLMILVVFFIWGLATRLKDSPIPKIPDILSTNEKKILALESEIKKLKLNNKSLLNKIASGDITGTEEVPNLLLVTKPYGMQNLTTSKNVHLEQIEFNDVNDRKTLKFNVVNSNATQRISGHILVFMTSEFGITGYPNSLNTNPVDGIKYTMGEYFAVSRLRPTEATFKIKTANDVRFIIYIFNRDGDLLHFEVTDIYKSTQGP